jgi:hypothetical protein
MSSSVITTVLAGNPQAAPSAPVAPNSIGLYPGATIDGVLINNELYGNTEGGFVPPITLAAGAYWAALSACTGNYDGHMVCTFLSFTDSNGNIVAGGNPDNFNPSQDPPIDLTGCRICNLSVGAGQYCDIIVFEVCENYQPSTAVVSSVDAVIAMIPAGETWSSFSDRVISNVQSYFYCASYMAGVTADASAQVEYYGNFAVSTGLSASTSSMAAIQTSCMQTMANSPSTTLTVPAGSTAFLLQAINIMGINGTTWAHPDNSGYPAWIILTEDRYSDLAGAYCLAAGVPELTGLGSETVNGLTMLTSS